MRTKRKKRIVILVSAILITVATVSLYARGSMGIASDNSADIVARVNKKEITRVEYERQLSIAQQQLLRSGQILDEASMERFREEVLENLIENELLYQESQNKGYKVNRKEVNEQFETIKSRFSDEEEFENAMNKMNYTESSLKSDIKRRIAIQNFIEKEITQNIIVSDAESLEYYKSNPEFFSQPMQIRASHILIMVEDQTNTEQKDEALRKIKEIKQKLNEGADFATLARESSQGPSSAQGGDLGYFQKGQMGLKTFEDAAFTLKPGEISDIVETRFGYHLIMVTDIKAEVTISYESVKENIDQYLKQNKMLEEVDSLLEKMKVDASIERFPTIVEKEGDQE